MVCILLEDTGKFWLDISISRVLVPFIITSCLEKRDTENVSALNTSTTDGKQSNKKLFPDVLMRPQGLEGPLINGIYAVNHPLGILRLPVSVTVFFSERTLQAF